MASREAVTTTKKGKKLGLVLLDYPHAPLVLQLAEKV
jgi:hypothetical protein